MCNDDYLTSSQTAANGAYIRICTISRVHSYISVEQTHFTSYDKLEEECHNVDSGEF